MPVVDLAFAVSGVSLPIDYGYALFSALCRIVPELHGDRRIGVHPIRGIKLEPRRLKLVPQSRLRLRLPSEEIAPYLAVAGKTLDLAGSRLSIGIPAVESLRPSADLSARLVTIGHHADPEPFLDSLRRQLSELDVSAEPGFVPSTDPAHPDQPTRRVVRIKDRAIVGYALRLSGLTAEESLIVQERGLGSRRRIGCGVFVPTPWSVAKPTPTEPSYS